MYCTNCGFNMGEANVCPECGKQKPEPIIFEPQASQSSATATQQQPAVEPKITRYSYEDSSAYRQTVDKTAPFQQAFEDDITQGRPTDNQAPYKQTIIFNNYNTNEYTDVNDDPRRARNHFASHKSKLTALVLAVLFGMFGVHRFYAGKIGTGTLWFFTFGLFGFGWIYDVIRIATGTFKDANGLPLI